MESDTAFGRDREEIRRQDYSLSDEQEAIRESFGRFFAENSKSDRVRAAEPLGFDRDLWTEVAELGVASIRLPEEMGGVGGSLVDLCLIAEEAGRRAAPVVIAEAAAAATCLASAGSNHLEDWLEAIPAGRKIITLALFPLGARRRQLIPAGAVADAVVALEGDELVLFEQDPVLPHTENLGSAPLALWAPEDSSGRHVLASGPEARLLHGRAVAEWRMLTAAALVGVAKQAITEAVEFAKTRLTSQVPIGALQGVSHPLADAEMLVSASRNLVRKAAWFLDNEPGCRTELIPIAFAHTDRAAAFATATALHMQGGFGFTVESDVTLYFCRAKGWSVVGAPADAVREVGGALAVAAGLNDDPVIKEDGYGLQPA